MKYSKTHMAEKTSFKEHEEYCKSIVTGGQHSYAAP